MAVFRIRYTRSDMEGECTALKFADSEATALSHLATGNKSKGYILNRPNKGRRIPIKLINIEKEC